MHGIRRITIALRAFSDYPAVCSAALSKLSEHFKTTPERKECLKRERKAMLDEDIVHQCAGQKVVVADYGPRLLACECCGEAPKLQRHEIKLFERMTGAIERDADWLKICLSGPYFACDDGELGQFAFTPQGCVACWDYICKRCKCEVALGDVQCQCGVADVTAILSEQAEGMLMQRADDYSSDAALPGARMSVVNPWREADAMVCEDVRNAELVCLHESLPKSTDVPDWPAGPKESMRSFLNHASRNWMEACTPACRCIMRRPRQRCTCVPDDWNTVAACWVHGWSRTHPRLQKYVYSASDIRTCFLRESQRRLARRAERDRQMQAIRDWVSERPQRRMQHEAPGYRFLDPWQLCQPLISLPDWLHDLVVPSVLQQAD
jgi:hypothetical protein